MAALTCAHCGQVLIGNGRPSKGKVYCPSCFDKLVKEQEVFEAEKQDLCIYLRKLFGLTEVPAEVVHAIDRLYRDGRKLKGMKATIYYYYEILGNDTYNVMLFSKIITEQYDNARMYLEKVRKIQQHNAEVDIKVPPMTYTISDKHKNKRKPQRRIEDL